MFEQYRVLSNKIPQYVNDVLDLNACVIPWPVKGYEAPHSYGGAVQFTLKHVVDQNIPLHQNSPEVHLPQYLLGHTRWSPALWRQRLECSIPGWYVSIHSLLNLKRPLETLPTDLRYRVTRGATECLSRDVSRVLAADERGIPLGYESMEDMPLEVKWRRLVQYPQLCELALRLHKTKDCPRVTKVDSMIKAKREEIESWSERDAA